MENPQQITLQFCGCVSGKLSAAVCMVLHKITVKKLVVSSALCLFVILFVTLCTCIISHTALIFKTKFS